MNILKNIVLALSIPFLAVYYFLHSSYKILFTNYDDGENELGNDGISSPWNITAAELSAAVLILPIIVVLEFLKAIKNEFSKSKTKVPSTKLRKNKSKKIDTNQNKNNLSLSSNQNGSPDTIRDIVSGDHKNKKSKKKSSDTAHIGHKRKATLSHHKTSDIDFISTSEVGRRTEITQKDIISYFIHEKLIRRVNKKLELTPLGYSIGGTNKAEGDYSWIVWPEWIVNHDIVKSFHAKKQNELLNKYGIKYLYHMSHTDNLANILKYGLFPHSNQYKKRDISNPDVNNRRNKREPIYHRKIHSYVPFYLNPRNAMLYVQEKKENIVIFAANPKIIFKNNSIITDGNASSKSTNFYRDAVDLGKLDWDCLYDTTWFNHKDGKRTKMAEVLVYPDVGIEYLDKIFVNNDIMFANSHHKCNTSCCLT